MRIAVLLLALTLLSVVPAAAQESTATPTAGPSLAAVAPRAILEALDAAAAPATLPGNTDAEIVLQTWEEHYGERLAATLGAWVMTGSAQLPMASVLVFPSAENAVAGLGEFRRDSSAATAGDLEAWTIADRGKWLCVAVDGPVMLIGQAEPAPGEDPGEDKEIVRDRSCEVTAATHAWLLDVVGLPAADATPIAGGSTDRAGWLARARHGPPLTPPRPARPAPAARPRAALPPVACRCGPPPPPAQ